MCLLLFLFFLVLLFLSVIHQLDSDTVLSLLDHIDTVLDTIILSTDPSTVLTADLTKHHDAIKTAAKQYLYSLDITLKPYQLISKCLQHLNKTLEGSKVDKTSDLQGEMQVSAEVSSSLLLFLVTLFTDLAMQIIDSDSNIEFLDPLPSDPIGTTSPLPETPTM